jgi:hypothetical protein
VNILISNNETETVKNLTKRCETLEQYCRELISTNKVLDAENRLCITQILGFQKQGGKQLDNMIGALELLK